MRIALPEASGTLREHARTGMPVVSAPLGADSAQRGMRLECFKPADRNGLLRDPESTARRWKALIALYVE